MIKRIIKTFTILIVILTLLYIIKITKYRIISSKNITNEINKDNAYSYIITGQKISIVNKVTNNYFYIPLDKKKEIIMKILIQNENGIKFIGHNIAPCNNSNNSVKNSCQMMIFTKESFLGLKEYKKPLCIENIINNETIKINLHNKNGYYMYNVYEPLIGGNEAKKAIEKIGNFEGIGGKTEGIYLYLGCSTGKIIEISVIEQK